MPRLFYGQISDGNLSGYSASSRKRSGADKIKCENDIKAAGIQAAFLFLPFKEKRIDKE